MRHSRSLLAFVLALVASLSAPQYGDGPKQSQNDQSSQFLGDTIVLTTDNYRFTPDTIRVRAGHYLRLRLNNQSDHEHNIAFTFNGQNYTLYRNVMRGETDDMRFLAPRVPGRYEFWCPVGDHAARGMKGWLIVE